MSNTTGKIDSAIDLVVRDLGRMSYAEAYLLQQQLQREVIDSRVDGNDARRMYLLLVEHDPPVITISRRKTAPGNLVATPEQLAKAGIEVAETDRGGDITYHGPGQLVAYPILDLNTLSLRLKSYMRFLEQVVIDTIRQFGIEGFRDPKATGVWINSSDIESKKFPKAQGSPSLGFEGQRTTEASSAKIAAFGVRVSRWVSMHGLALNVMPNLEHFDLIIPCGLAGRTVTSLQQQLSERCPSMDQVKTALVERFESVIAQVRS